MVFGGSPLHDQTKITQAIAEARGLNFPAKHDCNSPPQHSSFSSPTEMCGFIGQLRELSGGKPIGIKMCMGRPEEFASLVKAMQATGVKPDFITIDGAEGGTGAAPPEFSNSVGMPLADALTMAHGMLVGAGIRDEITLIASGKVLTGFSVVKTLALGADVCNAARAMMFALGCVQALKCNTNHCPTGITTQDPRLMNGLVVPDKAERVYHYQHKTVKAALDIIGAMGHDSPGKILPSDIVLRTGRGLVALDERYPQLRVLPGALLTGDGPTKLQAFWNASTTSGVNRTVAWRTPNPALP